MALPDDSTVEQPWWNERPSPGDSRRNGLAWLAVAAITFLIFEVTSSQSLALAIGCLKFAWHDFVIAHKICKADPNRIRGRVVAGFYRAWGFFKASSIALLLMFILIFAGAQFDAVGLHKLQSKALTALALAFGGFLLSVVCSAIMIGPALRHRIKIWVGSGSNRIRFILFANAITLFFCYCIGFVMLPLAVGGLARLLGGAIPENATTAVFGFIAVLGIPIGGAIILLGSMDYFSNLQAKSPEECWPVPLDFHSTTHEVAPFAHDPSHQGFVIE
jgi:hypothetical protein